MNNFVQSSNYFENRKCEYFPCHKNINPDIQGFNCQFCRCPYYNAIVCPGLVDGSVKKIQIRDGEYKDCTECLFPHMYSNREKLASTFVTRSAME